MDKEHTLDYLKNKLDQFVNERKWNEWQDPKNLSMSIAIESAELMELFQWIRTYELDDFIKKEENMKRIKEELADIMIYSLNLSNVLGIDVSDAIINKIEKNAQKYPTDEWKSTLNNKKD